MGPESVLVIGHPVPGAHAPVCCGAGLRSFCCCSTCERFVGLSWKAFLGVFSKSWLCVCVCVCVFASKPELVLEVMEAEPSAILTVRRQQKLEVRRVVQAQRDLQHKAEAGRERVCVCVRACVRARARVCVCVCCACARRARVSRMHLIFFANDAGAIRVI